MALTGTTLACLLPGTTHIGFVETVTLEKPGLTGLDVWLEFLVCLETARVAKEVCHNVPLLFGIESAASYNIFI
jgi:hypothetical protein